METTWLSLLPDNLQRAARSLRDQNVNEDAFTIVDALAALPHLRTSSVVVLGGDFWEEEEDGRLRPTYENWYLAEKEGELPGDRLQRSLTQAEQALRRHGSSGLVVLVCERGTGAASPHD